MNSAQVARGIEGYAAVLRASTEALSAAGVEHLVFGSIANRALGRPRPMATDEDVDLFVRPPDAPSALETLEQAGFVTVEQDPNWIHKARKGGVTVDVIFKAAGRVYMDHEMFERGISTAILGVDVRLIPGEDLALMKALIHDEGRAFDWFDAVALLAREGFDWDYLVRRAEAYGAHRVLSLMVFARTEGIPVPLPAIEHLRDVTRG